MAVYAYAAGFDDFAREGNNFYKAGKFDDAINSYSKALSSEQARTFPLKAANVLNMRGMLYREKGKFAQAVADFTRASELDVDGAIMYIYNRGHAYGPMGEYDKAIADFTKAIEMGFSPAGAHLGRGKALVIKGIYQEAVKDLSLAIQMDPRAAEAYKFRMTAYEKLGDKEKAAKDKEALRKMNEPMKGH